MSRRVLALRYGVLAYLGSLAVLAYTIGFLANMAVPKGVDDGPAGPAWAAVLVNVGLLGLFAVQHSVMARPWFKRWSTRSVPPAIERSTYVLAASLALALLLWQWRPLTGTVWSVESGGLRTLLWTAHGAGWGIALLSTFLIAFWMTPDMSVGRLLFVGAATGYILIGVRLEERDLRRQLGEAYARYAERVPRFIPRSDAMAVTRHTVASERAH